MTVYNDHGKETDEAPTARSSGLEMWFGRRWHRLLGNGNRELLPDGCQRDPAAVTAFTPRQTNVRFISYALKFLSVNQWLNMILITVARVDQGYTSKNPSTITAAFTMGN
ncbi:hypothetical protein GUJ93_ZPchr0006g44195 [Zizania palustris]|uniref:Uncharacterized protein n=1 Tax=Zizania palustris TaxID=103762 RepID=A0A8J5SIJ8_ZIZPA|nr:hypothetical protein GUJ93_ZPchr0006g44195 [Zizania palustris]